MASKRAWSVEYLQKQYQAMRWLYEQGATPEQIREMTWGKVDESERVVSLFTKVLNIVYNSEMDAMQKYEYEKELKVDFRDTEVEWFFTKSRINCPWMFTMRPAKTWRKQGSKEVLFPVKQIEETCGKSKLNHRLTKALPFANIKVSKENIKNQIKELIEKT